MSLRQMADEGRGLDEERAGEEGGVGIYSCVVLKLRGMPRGEVGELRVREYAGWCIIEMVLVSESSTLMCSSVDVLVASSML